MKYLFIIMFSLFGFSKNKAQAKSIHSFKVEALDGSTIDFSKFKGKKILVVNTASECGFTPQYKDLQKLADTYKNKLVVVGFPANNFGGQEPGSNKEIATFCQRNYGVDFPMASKISVKGDDIAPIPGTKRRKYLDDNIGSLDVVLNEADLARINEILPVGAAIGDRYASMASVDR